LKNYYLPVNDIIHILKQNHHVNIRTMRPCYDIITHRLALTDLSPAYGILKNNEEGYVKVLWNPYGLMNDKST
jgi:hypothetical protein